MTLQSSFLGTILCWQAVNLASLLRRPQAQQNTREFVRGSTVSMPFTPGTRPPYHVSVPAQSNRPAHSIAALRQVTKCPAQHAPALQTLQLRYVPLHSC